MSRRSGVRDTPAAAGVLYARSAAEFVDKVGVNVPYGVPSYSGPSDYPLSGRTNQNNSVDRWTGILKDIGFRRVRIATGLNNPYGDADSKTQTLAMVQRDLAKIVAACPKWGMPIWTTRDYTWLKTAADIPKPAWLEGANEPYGFGQYNQLGASSIISSGTAVTHASLVGQAVAVGTILSDGIRWYCRAAHTAGAGTVPSNLSDWASVNNWWIPLHQRACDVVEGYIDDIIATRGWTGVELLAPSVYSTGPAPVGTELLKRSMQTYPNRSGNLHEYSLQAFPYDIPEESGSGTYYTSSFPYLHPFTRSSKIHVTEWGAYRSGPADGLSHMPEDEGAHLTIRAIFAGDDAGVASMHHYQLCDEIITWDHFGTSISAGKCGFATNGAEQRMKTNGRHLKTMLSIYGQTTGGGLTNGALLPTWTSAPTRFRQYLHYLPDGRLLLAYVNATNVIASPLGGTFDTATGSNSNNTVAGTPGQYQNGSVVAAMPSPVAVTVKFDRGFSKVRSLATLETGTSWTDHGALAAGAVLTPPTVTGFIKILELTP